MVSLGLVLFAPIISLCILTYIMTNITETEQALFLYSMLAAVAEKNNIYDSCTHIFFYLSISVYSAKIRTQATVVKRQEVSDFFFPLAFETEQTTNLS